jgi:hypothetical protein
MGARYGALAVLDEPFGLVRVQLRLVLGGGALVDRAVLAHEDGRAAFVEADELRVNARWVVREVFVSFVVCPMGVVEGVEPLSDKGRPVGVVVEHREDGLVVQPEVHELIVPTGWRRVAPDLRVVGVLAPEDRGPRWTAERIRQPVVLERDALLLYLLLESWHPIKEPRVEVVGDHEDDVRRQVRHLRPRFVPRAKDNGHADRGHRHGEQDDQDREGWRRADDPS